MATYNFQVNPRLSLKLQAQTGNTAIATISSMSPSVIRPQVPTSAPPSGHLMAIHPMMGSTRPILITPQGFPVSTNHQIFGDRMFPSATIAPVFSSEINDASLDFNIIRQKSFENDAALQEKLHLQSPATDSQDLQNLTNVIDMEERKTPSEKNLPNEEKDKNNEPVSIEVDDNDCQIIADTHSRSDRINTAPQLTTASSAPNQKIPLLPTSSGVWNSNVNLPMLNVNQILTSNIIDPYLITGMRQTFNVFGNVLSQLPNNGVPAEDSNSHIKSIIHHKSCTLFPPNVNAPVPTTRDRPQGCKTVFVGGLPENIKEEIIREVFSFCGDISNLRLSTKKFCHIRFSEETAVDRALTLSGYRIRLGSSCDPPNTGRLHVDFAHARDDQFEWECKQRQIQREQRHKERMRRESSRDTSPSGPTHFTESEANNVLEKLKGEETFLKAISIAVCWLERGECNKRNVNTFYGMIQSVNSHIRRLLHEKNQCEGEYKKAKEMLKDRAQTILTQFAQIEKLFISSSHKKVWDHFTKAQRKNIEVWKKSAMEIKKLPPEVQESINDDEMDVSDSDSDDEGSLYKKRKLDVYETNSLKDENDSLRCQLEAYKNEICVVRSELQCEISRKNEQIAILQKTLNTLSQEMNKLKKDQMLISEPPTNSKANEKESHEADTTVVPTMSNLCSLVPKEAKLLGLISVFLHVHPFGAGVEYICSFLQKTIPALKVTEIENIMSKFPSVFQQEVVGIGANMERRWKYAGFNVENDLSIVQS